MLPDEGWSAAALHGLHECLYARGGPGVRPRSAPPRLLRGGGWTLCPEWSAGVMAVGPAAPEDRAGASSASASSAVGRASPARLAFREAGAPFSGASINPPQQHRPRVHVH